MSDMLKFFDRAIHCLESKVLMLHFTTAEHEGQFNLVTLTQKFFGVFDFEHEIMVFNSNTKFHFLHLSRRTLLVLALLFFLGEFVLILSKIEYAANRWSGGWGYFDKVQPGILGDNKGISRRHNSYLLPLGTNHTDFTGADFIVFTNSGNEVPSWTRASSWH